jgi:hypothetical protein
MVTHLWQFHSHGKDADGNDHTCHFQSDFVGTVRTRPSPPVRIEQIEHVRSDDDAKDGGDGGFTEVKALLDDEGEHALGPLSEIIAHASGL